MNTYFLLFYEFFKTGLFAVGGGLATLPFLAEMADHYTWFTHQQLADMVAVAESTPGPIGINAATYAGYNAGGVLGALIASLSTVLPAFILIMFVSRAFTKYKEQRLVQSAFSTMRPAVAGLIGASCWSMMSISIIDISAFGQAGFISLKNLILFAVLLVVTNFKKIKNLHPAAFIGIAAVIGIVFQF